MEMNKIGVTDSDQVRGDEIGGDLGGD